MREYQERAQASDQVPVRGEDQGLLVPLLGLAGEVGELLSEYKKYLRDGDAHRLFKDRVLEELGDLLWYTANVATKFELDLGEIAEANLAKVRDRWLLRGQSHPTHGISLGFDTDYPEHERLPRQFEVEIREIWNGDDVIVRTSVDGEKVGDDLTDNSYDPDGYRFHDVFHLAYAAVLG